MLADPSSRVRKFLSVAIAICPAAATWFPVAAIACGDRRGWLPSSATRRSGAVREGAIPCVVTEGGSGGARRRC